MKIAYSYVRFSSPQQARGDSLARQTLSADSWCRANGYALSAATYRDLGVSAFRGRNSARGALGAFLSAVQSGRVRPGSALVVESLDRLSRQHILEAVPVVSEILRAGVDIVTLIPSPRTLTRQSDDMEVMWSLLDMVRARQESVVKSERIHSAWAAKQKRAATGEIMTKCCPVWLRLDDGHWTVDTDRAALVKRIYTMGLTMGATAIAKQLNAEKIKPMGRGKWVANNVGTVLRNRRVLGEYQPHDSRDKSAGDVIPSYYPRIITDDLFYRVQAKLAQRHHSGGRRGIASCPCLFTRLWRCGETGSAFHLVDRSTKKKTYYYMVSAGQRAREGGASYFPYQIFERAFLRFLTEVKLSDLGDSEDITDELEGARGAVAETSHRIDKLQRDLEKGGDFDSGLRLLRSLETKREKQTAALDALKAKQATPASDALSDSRSIIAALDSAQGDELLDLRRRLKSRIADLVERIDVSVKGDRKRRGVVARVNFRAGGYRRFICWHFSADKRRTLFPTAGADGHLDIQTDKFDPDQWRSMDLTATT